MVCVFIVAYDVYRVHFLPHNEHSVFLLQRSNALISFSEIIGNYVDSHVKHENTVKNTTINMWLNDGVY